MIVDFITVARRTLLLLPFCLKLDIPNLLPHQTVYLTPIETFAAMSAPHELEAKPSITIGAASPDNQGPLPWVDESEEANESKPSWLKSPFKFY